MPQVSYFPNITSIDAASVKYTERHKAIGIDVIYCKGAADYDGHVIHQTSLHFQFHI